MIRKQKIRPGFISASENIFLVLIPCMLLVINGCAPVISEEVLREVNPQIELKDVLRDYNRTLGETIQWGGLILDARRVKNETLLEVSQWPTDFRGMPQDTGFSDGRFLALNKTPLDAFIFEKGRTVTIVGKIQGTLTIEEPGHSYPLIRIKEIHPWPGKGKDSEYNRYYYWAPWTQP